MKKTKKFVSFLAILLIAILTLSCCIFFACGSDDEEPEVTVPQDTTDDTTDNNDDETKSAVTAVTVNPETLTLAEGETDEITATVTLSDDADAGYEVAYAWASDNEAVAKVSGTGATITVTAGESGTANITVTADGKSATCTVTVTYRAMTDSDATALYEAIEKTCSYEGSYTSYGTWTYLENEESYDFEEQELEVSGYDDTDLYTNSYDSETGYTVYKDDWKKITTDEYGESENWSADYMYFVPDPDDEDGETFTLYEYYMSSGDEEAEKTYCTTDIDERNEYSNLGVATNLYFFMADDDEDFSCTSVDELIMRLCDLEDEDDYEAVAKVGTSGTDTIYTLSVTVCESDMDEYGTEDGEADEYGSEYTYTYDFEFYVNEDGLIYAYTSTETDTENTTDAEGGYYNETFVDYMAWEITYSFFDESLMLSEGEMAEYEEEI